MYENIKKYESKKKHIETIPENSKKENKGGPRRLSEDGIVVKLDDEDVKPQKENIDQTAKSELTDEDEYFYPEERKRNNTVK